MAADVVEGAQLAGLVAADDQRAPGDLDDDEVARLGDLGGHRDADPRAGEDALLLELEVVGRRVRVGDQRAGEIDGQPRRGVRRRVAERRARERPGGGGHRRAVRLHHHIVHGWCSACGDRVSADAERALDGARRLERERQRALARGRVEARASGRSRSACRRAGRARRSRSRCSRSPSSSSSTISREPDARTSSSSRRSTSASVIVCSRELLERLGERRGELLVVACSRAGACRSSSRAAGSGGPSSRRSSGATAGSICVTTSSDAVRLDDRERDRLAACCAASVSSARARRLDERLAHVDRAREAHELEAEHDAIALGKAHEQPLALERADQPERRRARETGGAGEARDRVAGRAARPPRGASRRPSGPTG